MDSAIDDGDGKRRMRRALVKLLKEGMWFFFSDYGKRPQNVKLHVLVINF